jgi:hypothetical protein
MMNNSNHTRSKIRSVSDMARMLSLGSVLITVYLLFGYDIPNRLPKRPIRVGDGRGDGESTW